MIGKTVSHYRITEQIGSGGMGVVYKAEDTKLKRTIALKFLPSSFSLDDEAKQRFIHEAQAASSLQHNNICTIHDIDETDEGQLFICMDCYEGESLKQKIERGPLKLNDAIDIAVQMFSAVGMGKMSIAYNTESSGEIEMPHAYVDEGWLKKWGKYKTPVNFIGAGYIAGMFAAVYDKPTRTYTVIEIQSMVMGSDKSVFKVNR